MSVYVIAALNIHDHEQYDQYAVKNVEIILKHGCEILVVNDELGVIEGTPPSRRLVVLKFPDQAAVDAWQNSDEYAAIRPLRQNSTETVFCITSESFAWPAQ